jgi:uncharacterized protein YjiK/methionine-rich copper-binding protein CopC
MKMKHNAYRIATSYQPSNSYSIVKTLRSTCTQFLLPAILAASLGACGGGGGSSDSGAANVGPLVNPTLTFTDPQSTWDLANYTQTDKCSLPVGSGNNLLAAEASGVTYNKDTNSLFVVGDGGTSVAQIAPTITGANCTLIDSMQLNAGDFVDTEGITYVGAGKFVLVEERVREVDQFTYTAGGTLARAGAQGVKLGTPVSNVGIEGVTFDPKSGGFIAVRQSQPTSIFQAMVNFAGGSATASDGSTINVSTLNPPFLFDASKTGLSAFNDVFALSNIVSNTAPDYDSMIIIGAPDGKIVKMDRAGKLLSSLAMSTTAQNEGVTMGPDGTIYVVGEQAAGPSLPGMTIFKPTTNTTNVGVGSNLYLTFNQSVQAGSGTITLSNGAGDTRTIPVGDTSQVSFSGKIMKIHPKFFLVANTTYTVTYAAGAVKSTSGSDAPAVSGNTFAFTTIGTVDNTVPSLNSTAPVDGATGIVGSHFTLFFNEAVQAGSGDIVISNGSDTRNVSITDTTQVKFNGGRVTVTLATPLTDNSSYTVQVASGVITDLSGNVYAGLSQGFTTAAAGAPAPTVLITEVNSNAPDGIDFFEIYNYGTSALNLTGWKWGDNHGDVNDANNSSAFSSGRTIAAGERLVVISAAPTSVAGFCTDWAITCPPVTVVGMLNVNNDAGNPIGLGKGDSVVLYDANGNVVGSVNYGAPFPATQGDGTTVSIPTVAGANAALVSASNHAGAVFTGGAASKSATWDGVSTTSPNYISATGSPGL